MKKMNNVELQNINGGGKISAALVSAIKGVLTVISDFGRDLGSGVRRIQTNSMCACR